MMQPGRRLGLTPLEMRARLDAFAARYDRRFISSDPLDLVRRFDRPEDREVVGLVAATLAYGRVAGILSSVDRVLAVIGPRPSRFVDAFDRRRDAPRLGGFRHRFTTGDDLALLFEGVRRAREAEGSLEAFFVRRDPDPGAPHLGAAMDAFGGALSGRGTPSARRGAFRLLPRPSDGSACKRHCLFLRWMVRPDDGIDCGAWTGVSPSRLIVPLDTHMARLARLLGWTRRATPSWNAALDATAALRALDPADPTRYDFALTRLGILGLVGTRDGRLRIRDVAEALAT